MNVLVVVHGGGGGGAETREASPLLLTLILTLVYNLSQALMHLSHYESITVMDYLLFY